MLKALLAGKLDGEFVRSPYAIEDLLTSVVLGTCAYLPPEAALLGFLRAARTTDGALLRERLADVVTVEALFWHQWNAVTDEGPGAGGAEPDLLLRFAHRAGNRSLLIVEAKLLSGKSSLPTTHGPVSDQLGKYWVHLLREADRSRAAPLGIVYLTAGTAIPIADFIETQTELDAKHVVPAPLYWLSWRHFVGSLPPTERGPMLADLVELLTDSWMLVEVVMEPWPRLERLPRAWTFEPSWRWATPVHVKAEWQFAPSWTWSASGAIPPWVFKPGE